MSDLLTDRALEGAERIALVIRLGMVVFITYEMSLHYALGDAIAMTFAFVLVLRSIRARGEP